MFPPPSVTVHVTVDVPNEYGPAGDTATVVPVPVTVGEPMDVLLVHIPASLLMFAVAGHEIVGNPSMVTSTTISAPEHCPVVDVVELIVYSTTALDDPVFTNTSGIVVPHPPPQSTLPVAVPLITTDVQVKLVFVTVEVIATLAAAPLKMVTLFAVATGVAPTVSTAVNAAPVHPDADVGITEYDTVSSAVPVLFNV